MYYQNESLITFDGERVEVCYGLKLTGSISHSPIGVKYPISL